MRRYLERAHLHPPGRRLEVQSGLRRKRLAARVDSFEGWPQGQGHARCTMTRKPRGKLALVLLNRVTIPRGTFETGSGPRSCQEFGLPEGPR